MTGRHHDIVEIAAELVHTTKHPDGTPKAYLLFDGARKAWVPAAAVEDHGDGTFSMPEALAHDKGFI